MPNKNRRTLFPFPPFFLLVFPFNSDSYRNSFLLFPLLFLWMGCAQIVPPSGGKKDTLAPKAIKYNPDSAQTHFDSKKITIGFNEYIQLADLQKELVVSPPAKRLPEITVKNKQLIIELKDSLIKNTTYSIRFGNSIKDITEQNSAHDFHYVFSTGNKIDTLSLSGTVRDALSLKPQKEVLVMLYTMPATQPDSLPFKQLPINYTKTKEDGSFTIQHIRAGNYKLFALKDENENFLFDIPTENIAFADTLLSVYKNQSSDLSLFKEPTHKQKLLKSSLIQKGCLLLVYAMPMSLLSLKGLNKQTKTEAFIQEYNATNDSIRLWFSDAGIDSLQFIASTESQKDTIKTRVVRSGIDVSGRGTAFKLYAAINAKKDKPFDLNQNIEFSFSHPIRSYKPAGIQFKSDSADWSHLFNTLQFKETPLQKKATVDFSKKKEATGYHLMIPAGVFTDMFGLTNDTIKVDFKTQEENFYGSMKLKMLANLKAKLMVQLMNEAGAIIPSSSAKGSIHSYTYLAPGAYTLRVLFDSNSDGRWTSGNYHSKQQPEKVMYYPKPIIIRANWEQEIEWNVE
jgi:uncharacterized protein (DUF2141 family)